MHALEPFVWENQPLLKSLKRLIVADQGSHQLDLARFFFGEAQSVYCQHLRTRDDIVGEDVASITLKMKDVDYVKLVNNELSGQKAFMSGKLKFKGDMNAGMKLQKLGII